MKYLILFAFLINVPFVIMDNPQICKDTGCTSADIPGTWITMASKCITDTKAQILVEMQAAMKYMSLAAHFSKDDVNRPGFAKFFFESANEEREHGMKLISYLSMRGEFESSEPLMNLVKYDDAVKTVPNTRATIESGLAALKKALETEESVTKNIRALIATCDSEKLKLEDKGDYHFVDLLTSEYLTEQYEGQRKIVGMISTLTKMYHKHGSLSEFLFDKKLLRGELF